MHLLQTKSNRGQIDYIKWRINSICIQSIHIIRKIYCASSTLSYPSLPKSIKIACIRRTALSFFRALLHYWNSFPSHCSIIFALPRQFFPKRNDEVLQFIFDFGMGQAVVDASGHETEFVTDVIAGAFKAFCEYTLRLIQGVDGIGQLYLTPAPGAWFSRILKISGVNK